MERKWFVICTKKQHEKKVTALLTKKGIENYCPFTNTEKTMGVNKITIHEPLFKTFVFALLADSEISMVKGISGIINTVYWKSNPVIMRQEEIDALKVMAENFVSIGIERAAVCINDQIEIFKENIAEIGNNLMEIHQQTIAITLNSIGYTVFANKENLKYSPLEKPLSEGGILKKLNLFSILGF